MFQSKDHFKKAIRYCRMFFYCIPLLFAGGVLCGCGGVQEKKFSLGETPWRHLEPLRLVGGISVENRKINYHVLGTGDDVVFVVIFLSINQGDFKTISQNTGKFLVRIESDTLDLFTFEGCFF